MGAGLGPGGARPWPGSEGRGPVLERPVARTLGGAGAGRRSLLAK